MRTRVLKFTKKDGSVDMERLVSTLRNSVALLPNGDYSCTIERVQRKRSLDQNALMWLWFTCIADEIGETKEDIYDYYVGKFLRSVGEVRGEQFYKVLRTSKLTTEQFKTFLDHVQAHAASFFGITLPNPDDLAFEAFAAEYSRRAQ